MYSSPLNGLSRWSRGLLGVSPRTYQAGATLRRLEQDLYGLRCEALGAGQMRCFVEQQALFDVQERPQALFMAHIVHCEFSIALATPRPALPAGRVVIRHTGQLKRTGLAYQTRPVAEANLQQLVAQLSANETLQTALLALDFQYCELSGGPEGWHFKLEPFAASEVISRLPPMRRYLKLEREQYGHLLVCLRLVREEWQRSCATY